MLKKNLPLIIRCLVSALFLLSAVAKLYPTPMYGITKIFEEGQLIPMGFGESIVPYISRLIIGLEFFIAFAILQKNYLKRIIIPLSLLLLVAFTLHLSFQIFSGDNENCGCFGELIPMTPIEAFIKNVITILVLIFLYRVTSFNIHNKRSSIIIQFLCVMLFMFAFIPVQTVSNNQRVSNFSEYVISEFNINEGKKVLCFFDAGCEHCMEVGKSLNVLSETIDDFPEIHIIFSDTEEEKIPLFFEYIGKPLSYQVLPFFNDDDEINSYLEVLGYEYENPAIIYLDNGNQLRFYDGTGLNEYNEDEFRKLFVE